MDPDNWKQGPCYCYRNAFLFCNYQCPNIAVFRHYFVNYHLKAKQLCALKLNVQTSRAARIMVVSWERSPHSARKVRVKAWTKMGEMKLCHFPWGKVVPDPASTSAVPLMSLDRWSYTNKTHRYCTTSLPIMVYLQIEASHFFSPTCRPATDQGSGTLFTGCLDNNVNDSSGSIYSVVALPSVRLF